jgi:hypothetical protein
MSAHVKHVIWAITAIIVGVGIFWVRGIYETRQAQIMKDRDVEISKNQATVANAQKTVQNAQQANTAIDYQTKAQIAQLQQQLAARPDSAQIRAIVEAALPGTQSVVGRDAQGNPIIGFADTQGNRDVINQAVTNAKICNVNLSDCQQKQANLNTIIGAQNNEIAADKSTIDLQLKQMNDLRKFQVPRWTLLMGAGKSQGSSFQSAQSYQPVLGIDYRLTNRFGVFGLAQNKSAAAGISWHFGAIR